MDNELTYDEPRPILTLKPSDDIVTFYDTSNGQIIGKLTKKDGKMVFNGDVEKSAKIFFEQVIKYHDKQWKK